MTRARDFADVISGQHNLPLGSLGNAIPTGSITTAKIANDAVNASKIDDGEVRTAAILDGNVTTSKIADSAVTDVKINGMSSSKLSGALPAIDGSSLTGINSGFTFPAIQALNGQTNVDFTGIPSGTNIIKFSMWRTSGSTTPSVPAIQIGDSGGIETSGYATQDTFVGLTASSNYGGSSNTASSWNASQWTAASNVMTICGEIFRMYGNIWFCQAAFLQNDTNPNYFNNLRGFKELSGELTQIRFTRTAGTYDDANSYVRIGYQ